MTTAPILIRIKAKTSELVAEELRSKAVVIARMLDLITEANKLGHTHKAILQSINAGGLDTGMNNYRVYLHRARQSRERTIPPGAQPEDKGGSQPLVQREISPPASLPDIGAAGEGSVTQVRDALVGAKQTATTDYSQYARNLIKSRKAKK